MHCAEPLRQPVVFPGAHAFGELHLADAERLGGVINNPVGDALASACSAFGKAHQCAQIGAVLEGDLQRAR